MLGSWGHGVAGVGKGCFLYFLGPVDPQIFHLLGPIENSMYYPTEEGEVMVHSM